MKKSNKKYSAQNSSDVGEIKAFIEKKKTENSVLKRIISKISDTSSQSQKCNEDGQIMKFDTKLIQTQKRKEGKTKK